MVKLLEQLLELVIKKKYTAVFAGLALLGTGFLTYAGSEYTEKNDKQIEQLTENQRDITTTLEIMQIVMKDLKNVVNKVDDTNRKMMDTVLDLSKEVYKRKEN